MATFTTSQREEWGKFESIANLREYFMAKAGTVLYFKEESFWTYVKHVKYFTEFLGYGDPDEALAALRGMGKKERTGTLVKFIAGMRERGCAPATQKTVYALVKKWLLVNEVEMNWIKIVTPKVRPVVQDRAPTKEELRMILSYLRPWMVPTALILEASGMRVGTLSQLKMRHVNFGADPEIAVIEVPPEANKTTGVGFFTCITPEARRALEAYIEQRRKRGEDVGPDSPLIKGRMSDGGAPPSSVRDGWNKALNNAGLNKKTGQRLKDGKLVGGYYELHVHTLRKFFRSQVEGILTKSIREAFMGHITTEYLDRNYLRIPEERLIVEYRKAVPVLTIYEDVQSDEYQKKQLLRQAALLLSPEKLAALKNIMASEMNLDKVVNEYRKMMLQPDNGTYEVVTGEETLLKRLSEGYKLEKELNGDKYLVIHN